MVAAVITDYRTAPISERLRAALAFVEKLAAFPDRVGASDVLALRATGCTEQDIRDAIAVCTCFSVITRIADALGFEVGDARAQRWVGRILAGVGYSAGTLPG